MEEQKTFSKSKKIMVFCLAIFFVCSCVGCGLLHWLNNQNKLLNATTNTDTTSYVSVGEIWNAETGQFDADNLTALLQYTTGNTSVTSLDIKSSGSLGNGLSTSNTTYAQNKALTSADIRASTANGKTSSQDVQVTFGGLTWQVVYLTKDKQGNDIVTLWLSSNKQDAWAGRSATEGAYYGFVDGALYSDWSNNFQNSSFTVTYPSNLYGASYVRAVTLNNGGTYAISTSSVTTIGQNDNSVFALFTMDSVAGSVKQYLVTPNQVGYQATENANTQFGDANYYPNEAYGTPNGNGSWSTGNGGAENITKNRYYTTWAEDTIWLPSRTETGDSGTSGSSAGIWQTSQSQRANGNGSSSPTSMGSVGTSNGTAYNCSGLRSGRYDHAITAYYLRASGSGSSPGNVYDSLAVRPALHFNLNLAASNATEPTQPILEDWSQPNSEENPFIINTIQKLTYLSDNYIWAADKYFLQTENLDLNNEPWTPINNVTSTSGSNQRAYYYDGGEHTISNLYINTSEQTLNSKNYIGLFGYVSGTSSKPAYIKNLGIVGGSVSGNQYIGAVVGYAEYTDITSCYNEGVSVTGDGNYVGGIAGYNYSGIISNSYNTGAVTGDSQVGGVVGSSSGTISNSYNTGTVTGYEHVGGVAGLNADGTINNSYNTGDVTGDYEVGGIVGWNQYTTAVVSNSYNTGDVTGDGSVGGVAGTNFGPISNSYNTGEITGTDYVGGVVGDNSGTISDSYNTGDVTGDYEVGGVAGDNSYGTISNSYNTGTVTGAGYVGGVAGYIYGSSSSPAIISSCYSTGEIIRSSGSETSFGGVVGYIENSTNYPSQYVSISWCYYNTQTSGNVVTKAIGNGNGYQCYGLTTTEMQGAQNENWMYLSSTFWNFASGQYPTLKYVAKPTQN